MPNPNCQTCKGLGGYPRCPECLNDTPETDEENADPYVIEAAKAAINTLVRENERLRSARAKAENAECLLDLKLGMMEQDIETIRKIITKGGTTADVLKFLDTPNA